MAEVEIVLKPHDDPAAVAAEFLDIVDRGEHPPRALCMAVADMIEEATKNSRLMRKIEKRWRHGTWRMVADVVGSEHLAAKLIYEAGACGDIDQESVRQAIRRLGLGGSKTVHIRIQSTK